MQRSRNAVARHDQSRDQFAEPFAILSELFELLEDYAPMWYTEELHNRAEAALENSSLRLSDRALKSTKRTAPPTAIAVGARASA